MIVNRPEQGIIAKLREPNPRDPEADAISRQKRISRKQALQDDSYKLTQNAELLVRVIDSETQSADKVEETYKSIFMDPSKTSEAVQLKTEIAVRRERVSRLESDLTNLRFRIGTLDSEIVRIDAEEKRSSEDEESAEFISTMGNEALAHIDTVVDSLKALRSICVRAHYDLAAGRSEDNAERFRVLADNVAKAFRIRVFDETYHFSVPDNSLFMLFLLNKDFK